MPKTGNGLLCRRVWIGKRKDFGGKVAGVTDLPQCPYDGLHIGMAQPDSPSIGIRKMHVAQLWSGKTKSGGNIRLLDVHVEQIAKQFYVSRPQGVEKFHRFSDTVEQVRLVAIEELIKQRCPERLCSRSELFQRLSQPGYGLLARHGAVP